jgi:hypothetical protein
MLRKRYFTLIMVIVLVTIAFSIQHYQVRAQTEELINYTNVDGSKYPKIVGKVGDLTISNREYATMVYLIKIKYQNADQNKDEKFYEKEALRKIILDKLYELEAKKYGLFVSEQEVDNYLNNMLKLYSSMDDKDKEKAKFLEIIKQDGFNNVEEFINNQQMKNAYKKALLKVKLRNYIMSKAKYPSEADVDKFIAENNLQSLNVDRAMLKQQLYQKNKIDEWNNYSKLLLKSNNYEIYIPITIDK